MKAYEIMDILFSMADMSGFDNTCDTLKCGQADKEVKKVAVTMFPTVDVIKQAAEWSTDLLIVHEPLYYNHLDKEITPRELASLMEERLCINHLRIAGNTDSPCRVLSGKFGSPGGVGRELRNEKSEIILVGEVCEWADCEYARYAAALGCKKSIIAMGHIPSERNGMMYIADLLKKKCPDTEIRYFESGEVYQ